MRPSLRFATHQLRATGSTVLSQVADTVAINVIFWSWSASKDPSSFLGKMEASQRWAWIWQKIGREYGIKFAVAVILTPAVYAAAPGYPCQREADRDPRQLAQPAHDRRVHSEGRREAQQAEDEVEPTLLRSQLEGNEHGQVGGEL